MHGEISHDNVKHLSQLTDGLYKTIVQTTQGGNFSHDILRYCCIHIGFLISPQRNNPKGWTNTIDIWTNHDAIDMLPSLSSTSRHNCQNGTHTFGQQLSAEQMKSLKSWCKHTQRYGIQHYKISLKYLYQKGYSQ